MEKKGRSQHPSRSDSSKQEPDCDYPITARNDSKPATAATGSGANGHPGCGLELAYILDTFPIVRRKDEEKHGEYRIRRLVLENLEALREFKT